MSIIRLRGHHIAAMTDYKKAPYKFFRRIIKVYGIESAKKIRDMVSKIEDDTNILLVRDIDDICDRCTYKSYCEFDNYEGLNKAMLDNYPKDDIKGYKILQSILKDTVNMNPLSEAVFLIKELGLERDKTYKWGFLQQKYESYMDDFMKSLDSSRRRTTNESD